MKFRIERDVLYEAVQHATAVLPNSESRPTLSNLLIDVRADRLRLLATDLTLGAVVELGLDVAEPGLVMVPFRKLRDALKTAPSGPVQVVTSGTNEFNLYAQCGEDLPVSKTHWQLHYQGPQDYPDFPTFGREVVTVDREELVQSLARVSVAIPEDNDVAKSHLKAVYFQGGCVYAMDAHMAMRDICSVRVDGLVVPERAVRVLVALLKGAADQNVEICRSASYVLFRFGGRCYHSALRDQKYPDVEAHAFGSTDGFTRRISVPREELMSAIARAAVCHDEKFWLTLHYEKQHLLVTTRDTNDTFAALVEDVQLTGEPDEPVTRYIKLEAMRQLLKACRNDRVSIMVGDGSTAAQAALRVEDDGLVGVLFPIRVQAQSGAA